MSSLVESGVYYAVSAFGAVVRRLPVTAALAFGRFIGSLVYYFDIRHKSIAYGNLKIAFAQTKAPDELKHITKSLFQNYGQNLIELLRMPLLNRGNYKNYIVIEGDSHIHQARQKGNGVIFLAMHFGSWELTNLASAILGPYKVLVKPQTKYSRLDRLLNSYRECGGSVVLERGWGTREIIRALKNNEIVGMVVDQGGREGLLVPFFGRPASMSVGAIRIGMKFGVPICFSVIIREQGARHRMIIHPPLELEHTGDQDEDIRRALVKITCLMEEYIRKYPSHYAWFYKTWKYSKEAVIVVLKDNRTGHWRQSQAVAKQLQTALTERGIHSTTKEIEVRYRSRFAGRLLAVLSVFSNPYLSQGRLGFLKRFLRPETYNEIMSVKADFLISCGSSVAAVNYLLAHDQQAKSCVILNPGLLPLNRFDLAILPQHDGMPDGKNGVPAKTVPSGAPGEFQPLVITKGAPNLIDEEYLSRQTEALLERFSHLKRSERFKIGLFLGGETKHHYLDEQKMRILAQQISQVAEELNAEVLATTSRRTPAKIEVIVQRELKREYCPLLILANRNNVPEAVGGILGLADLVVVTGDSISMVSEAACSGKKTIVVPPDNRASVLKKKSKHHHFIELLHAQGYIVSAGPRDIRQAIYNLAKNKIQTRKLDDNAAILEAMRLLV